jgi:hypothetical protein
MSWPNAGPLSPFIWSLFSATTDVTVILQLILMGPVLVTAV